MKKHFDQNEKQAFLRGRGDITSFLINKLENLFNKYQNVKEFKDVQIDYVIDLVLEILGVKKEREGFRTLFL